MIERKRFILNFENKDIKYIFLKELTHLLNTWCTKVGKMIFLKFTFSSSSGVILVPGAGNRDVTCEAGTRLTPAAAARVSAFCLRKVFV